MPPEKHREVSSKGGSHKGPKGFALYTKEERKLKASNAAKARWAKVKAARKASENVT